MQWNQIKTLFILCFLVLDVYLLVKFIDKQEQTNLGVLEQEDTTIEQQLESEDITLPELPDDLDEKEYYISVSPKKFTDSDINNLGKLDNQTPTIIDDRFIISKFKDPVSIPVDGGNEDISSVLSDKLLYSGKYVYWDYDESLGMLILFQKKNDRPIYYNENAIILVFLNDDNEAIFYTQTMLDDLQTSGDKYTLIKPIKAIETLYNSNEFTTGTDITSIDMGFHTRIPLESGVQVFSPTWRVTVDGEKNYFVNAIEGFVYASKDVSFLRDSLQSISDKMKEISDKSFKKDITEMLDERFNVLEGSEITE